MAPDPGRSLRSLTFALLAVAAVAIQIATHDSQPLLACAGLAGLWVAVAVVVAVVLPRPRHPDASPPRLAFGVMLALALLPFIVDPIRRRYFQVGDPLEIQMVCSLCNLALALAACSAWTICLRIASIASLFLMLFAAIMTDHPAVKLLVGAYAVIGSLWLTIWHWSFLRPNSGDGMVPHRINTPRFAVPWIATLLAVALVTAASVLVTLGPKRVIASLGEWMPSSGGTDAYDPFARGGVNDGDDETRGQNAQTTGMLPSDTFLDSPLPSLYDAVNELYGEPFKVKEQERSIGLGPKDKVRESEKQPANNLRPNREHAMRRESPTKPRFGTDRDARAIFEVQGRTPLYLRVLAYDQYVGGAWKEAPIGPPFPRLEKEPDSNWMSLVLRYARPIFAENDFHSIKLAAPSGPLLPTPPHLVRFRVGRVDRAEFFAWGQDRILRFAHREAPSGIAIETESRSIDDFLLQSLEFNANQIGSHADYFELPGEATETLTAIARQWTAGVPRGWPQIDAVVKRLRTDYTHDPTAARLSVGDPVVQFLAQTRRGADDQFAASAALLLRALGYPTRLVSGYYVSPTRFDTESAHTPVIAEDLHFWAEVLLPWDDWLTLEPTPGYELPGPNPSWSARFLTALGRVGEWLQRNWVLVGALTVSLGVGFWFRFEIADAVITAAVRLFPGHGWQSRVRRTMAALEFRGRWFGRPRSKQQTRSAWVTTLAACSPDESLVRLAAMSDWAAYAPTLEVPWTDREVTHVCLRALDEWRLSRWRSVTEFSAQRGISP